MAGCSEQEKRIGDVGDRSFSNVLSSKFISPNLFIYFVNYDFEYGILSIQFFIAEVFGEGYLNFYSVAWMSPDKLFFKVIDISVPTPYVFPPSNSAPSTVPT